MKFGDLGFGGTEPYDHRRHTFITVYTVSLHA